MVDRFKQLLAEFSKMFKSRRNDNRNENKRNC